MSVKVVGQFPDQDSEENSGLGVQFRNLPWGPWGLVLGLQSGGDSYRVRRRGKSRSSLQMASLHPGGYTEPDETGFFSEESVGPGSVEVLKLRSTHSPSDSVRRPV